MAGPIMAGPALVERRLMRRNLDRRARVVIGAAWGDEGKGLLTDALAEARTLVIRFNGGAQAGHTVVAPDGRRHVFHHLGSGSFRGASTFLSRFFISNPLAFLPEIEALHGLGVTPVILADPRGPVTTPWDMMLNQMVEERRGTGRHGSCGLGINETVTRHGSPGLPRLTVGDLADASRVEAILRALRRDWVPRRLAALGLAPDPAWQARLDSESARAAFLEAASRFAGRVTPADDAIAAHDGPVLFEGAQGLLLDERHRWFPHVTRSRTGLANVDILAREAGIAALDVSYATRAYATRHGAGPFPREVPGLAYEDRTNVPNLWQQTIRFGHLDLDLLAETIRGDLGRTGLPVTYRLAVTCLDQVGDAVAFWQDGRCRTAAPQDLVKAAMDAAERAADGGAALARPVVTSRGPMRDMLTGL
jgi:adenylosuccinate synthase